MTTSTLPVSQRAINTLRGLAMDMVEAANSGHPGLPMGAAVMAHQLWTGPLSVDPSQPEWFDRDRFILSAGHGSALLYGLLHLAGFDLPMEELQNFRQWGSKTPGHPENGLTPGVEMATGPLGQGISTAVGMAMAERWLAARFNRPGHDVVDHRTWVIASDGDLMEGVAQEAISLAGHQKLNKLVVLYDDNKITIDGRTELAFTEDTELKFKSVGWRVLHCDGMDAAAVDAALTEAQTPAEGPTVIICRTIIGFGSPNKADSAGVHGSPLGATELDLAKDQLGIPREPKFLVEDDVRAHLAAAMAKGTTRRADWEARMRAYAAAHPEDAATLQRIIRGELPAGWDAALFAEEKADATRNQCGRALDAVAGAVVELIGGSADLSGSTKTALKGQASLQATEPGGRNINYGVREHAMGAIVNGMTLHGLRPLGATFLIFSDYCRPSLRLAGLMHCPSLFFFSHDSIGLGEDGPTHQPVEQTMSLRLIPNLNVFRPADGYELQVAVHQAMTQRTTPSCIITTRQTLPMVSPAGSVNHPAMRGGYVLREASAAPQVILVATGSEVSIACEAQIHLEAEGVPTRVVSLPCWEIFEAQDASYRAEVFPLGVPCVSIEAGTTLGWARYAQAHVGLDHFGASAPAERLFEEFGITPENVVKTARALIR
ncbi:MAG: transketolase [Armatimonadota bacterium]|nr:transketolase [Fimbriimonadaceae bacterium]MCZ8139337.1 transketolase [Fimbriimonadaceae bacterium]